MPSSTATRIVFLHAVEEGPANQSYGIQVAALAGIPGIGRRAPRASNCANSSNAPSINPLQPDLFAQDFAVEAVEPETHPVVERLAGIDPDSLTPREALDLLYALKKLAG